MKHSKPLGAMLDSLLKYSPSNDRTRPVYAELTTILLPVDGIEKMARSRNPLDTEAAHAKKVALAAEKMRQSFDRSRERVERLRDASLAAIDADINAKTRLQPTAQSAEIRAVLRQMDNPARLAALVKAIDAKDTATLAAIADGNQITTGLDDEVRLRLLDTYNMRTAPDLYDERKRLLEISDHVPSLFNEAMAAARDATDPAFIAEINELEAKAKAAESDFAQTLI
jgi:hypothetical protein